MRKNYRTNLINNINQIIYKSIENRLIFPQSSTVERLIINIIVLLSVGISIPKDGCVVWSSIFASGSVWILILCSYQTSIYTSLSKSQAIQLFSQSLISLRLGSASSSTPACNIQQTVFGV